MEQIKVAWYSLNEEGLFIWGDCRSLAQNPLAQTLPDDMHMSLGCLIRDRVWGGAVAAVGIIAAFILGTRTRLLPQLASLL